jgi:hypothetical protein
VRATIGRSYRAREGRTRDPEDLRRNIVVGSVEAPDPAIRVAHGIRGSDKKTTSDDVLEGVGGGSGEFEVKIIKRPCIAVTRLPGHPIGNSEICDRLILFEVRGGWADQMRVHTRAKLKPRGDGRSVARKHGVEPVAEDEAVEAGGR